MIEAHTASTVENSLLAAIPLVPLLGALVITQMMRRDAHHQGVSGWLATAFAFLSFAITVQLFSTSVLNNSAVTYKLWTWFEVGGFKADLGFKMDQLSGIMTLVVTGVGSLIHLYAIGYMEHDEHRARFFCYLNLFLFAMLLLVLGDNLLMMFAGWEGVGLCSYLLIGFWYKEMPNANAGQKAFVVNRIGDAAFLLGIFLLFHATGTINFHDLSLALPNATWDIKEIAALFLFIGAVGKSAQFPLYVWLPDAMAGPTPVSALIHAATMVTAGIYMITRMEFLYMQAPHVLGIISIVGTFTALLAATIALAQNDIKKVLAYSTVSQLGFMFMALGAGAFSNGIFHVVTHAFFKACLFMGAGSVIMGCHHEQDMRHFGGLAKKMPLTFITYFVATLAIAGFPFLSGFFSKDAILWAVYSSSNITSKVMLLENLSLSHFLWGVGAFTAFLTAFYMTRSLVLTFFGTYRGQAHPHESPWVVTVPLLILAALSAGFGLWDGGKLLHFLGQWTRADLQAGHDALAHNAEFKTLEHLSMGIAVSGIALAFVLYLLAPAVISRIAKTFSFVHRALLNKWWVDELYEAIIVKPLGVVAKIFFRVFDRFIIDGTVDGVAEVIDVNQDILRRVHTGRISFYAMMMFISIVFFIVFWMIL